MIEQTRIYIMCAILINADSIALRKVNVMSHPALCRPVSLSDAHVSIAYSVDLSGHFFTPRNAKRPSQE